MRTPHALALALALASSSCGLGYNEAEYFWIRNAGADMPVMVRGAAESGVFIIYNHGGPGGSGVLESNLEAFQQLEGDYAMVYWDQRVSGNAQGDVEPAEIELDTFLADLDLLVDTIDERYAPSAIFMLGHSWGGTLSAAYVSEPSHQAKLAGWIEVDGGHDMPRMHALSLAWVDAHAEAEIAAGRELERWTEARAWIAAAPEPASWGLDEYLGFLPYLRAAEPYWYDEAERPPAEIGKFVFASPISFALLFNPGALLPNFNILAFDFSTPEAMGQIELPTLILWGEHDGVSPPEMALDAYEAIPAADKQMIVYESAGHSPHAERTTAFVADVGAFIEAHR